MTPEEQQALVQFFGTVHAQAKSADQMIVHGAKDLRPVSTEIQNQLQQFLVSQRPPQYQQPVQSEPVAFMPPPPQYVPQVQHAPEPQPAEQQLDFFTYNANNDNQAMDKIVKRVTEAANYLHDIKVSLKTIVEILEKNSIQSDTDHNVKASSKNRVKE